MIGNYRNIIILVFVLIFSVACQDLKKSEKPEDLIPEAKMIDVLTEISLLHAARNYNKQKLEATGTNLDTYIYEKFDIDSLQLEQSSNWYAEQFTQYERIYDSVKARIERDKNILDSIREIEIEIEDSIKAAKKDSIKLLDSLAVNPRLRDSIKKDSIERSEMDVKKKDSLINSPVSIENDFN